MNKIYNEISFCKRDFEDETKFWETVNTQMRILLENDYIFKVRYEDNNVVEFQFNIDPNLYGGPSLEWLDEDEYIQKSE